ncbi:MAG: hypothetical protein A2172_00785 [Candidatus Woykebacteria bacterium RBG_13_40_15]|uniref:Uncharacterized protein n=1 Tax=Candidatus Woykebacteria bacterium RBG_13_40_15 TaxID=1802593 RepID=A0A1G1W8R4_9BACT|nr:MAG: hypothetical protein A2172_00785 [Candidatus Woykebacteria bacterium RBG_13_40_15]
MLSQFKKLLFKFPILLFLYCFILKLGVAYAGNEDLDLNPSPVTDLVKIFENALSAVIILGGLASFVMIIVSGFKFIAAQGDPKALMSARSSLLWAIAGVAFIIIAWLVLQFIANFTGVNVTIFRLNFNLE